MTIGWVKAASVFQEWLHDDRVLLARSTLTERSGKFKAVIVGVVAGESSFVIGLRELSDDTTSIVRDLAIDLSGCAFCLGEPAQRSPRPVSVSIFRSPGQTISFSQDK